MTSSWFLERPYEKSYSTTPAATTSKSTEKSGDLFIFSKFEADRS